MIDHRSYTDNLNSFEIKAQIKTALFVCIAAMINHVLVIVILLTILYRIKRNNNPPPPQNNDEGAKEQKRLILASLILEGGGEGWPRCFIYFVQDGSSSRGGCKCTYSISVMISLQLAIFSCFPSW